jgi:hypothetical protein
MLVATTQMKWVITCSAVKLGSSRTAKTISLNYDSTCAILDDNTTKCWGDNEYGKLGLGDRSTIVAMTPHEDGDRSPDRRFWHAISMQ